MKKCKIHPHSTIVSFCAACRGSIRSEKKARASRRNGSRYGGRPKAS